MGQLGTFSNNGLGFGLNFVLRDFFSNTAKKIKGEMSSLEGKSEEMVATITRSYQKLKSGVKMLAVGGVIALGLSAAVGHSMDFNKAMSAVEAKISDLDVPMQVLKKNALDLGTQTKFTATEAGEGMEFLAMTGLNASQIISGMPGLLDLAAAGNLGLARSADIATNIMTALGMKAADLTRIADVLAKTITTSNVNMEQLGYTMKFAAPRAGQLGVSLERLAALSGMLGDVGIQGSIAGTSLREFFTNLARVKDKGKLGAFKQLGLGISDIVDSEGNLRDIGVVMSKLLDKFRGLGNIESAALATKIFGVGGDSVIAGLLSKSSKDFDTYFNSLSNSQGQAGKVANKMLDNFAGDMTKFKSIFNTTLINIGDAVEPSLRPVTKMFTGLMTVLNKIASSPVGRFFIQLIALLSSMLVVLGLVKISLAAGRIAWLLFGKAALASLIPLIPYIAVIGAVVGVIAGLVYMINRGVTAFNEIDGATTGFTRWLQKLGGVVSVIDAVWKSWDSLTQTFSLTGEMRDKLKRLGILETALGIATWVIRIKEFFKGIGTGITQAWGVISNVVGMITRGFTSMLSMIGIDIDKNISSLNAWATTGKIVGYVLVGILALIALKFLIIGVNALIAFSPILLIIGAIALAVWGLMKLWDMFGDTIKEKFAGVARGFKSMGTLLRVEGKRMMHRLWEGIKSVIPMIIRSMEMIPGIGLMLKGIRMVGGAVENYFSNDAPNAPITAPEAGIGAQAADFNVATTPSPVRFNPNINVPQNDRPIMIQNVIELDGEVAAKSVNNYNEQNDNLQ